MAATIDLAGITATCRNLTWESSDPALARVLQLLTVDPTGRSPSDPNPDYTAALKAKDLFDATITKFDPMDDGSKGEVY